MDKLLQRKQQKFSKKKLWEACAICIMNIIEYTVLSGFWIGQCI